MNLDEAVDKVLLGVNRSISWSVLYNKLCELLGDDFDSFMPFYENVDEMMWEKGFKQDMKDIPTYYRKDYKQNKIKRVNKNQGKLF
jgi:transcription elongation factor GreA-like protein